MIHFILVETALELMPKSVANTPVVQKNIKKLGNSAKLLDSALHHSIMANLPDSNKRGRPDILHHFLLNTLGSPLNQHGKLRIHFSCPKGLFNVDSSMRCPRDPNRFKGLMVQLLEKEHVPPKPPYFISKAQENFSTWMTERFKPDNVLKLTSSGTSTTFNQLYQDIHETSDDWAVFIGGFQKGSFSKEVSNIRGKSVALGVQGYDSWTIIARLLTIFEVALGIL